MKWLLPGWSKVLSFIWRLGVFALISVLFAPSIRFHRAYCIIERAMRADVVCDFAITPLTQLPVLTSPTGARICGGNSRICVAIAGALARCNLQNPVVANRQNLGITAGWIWGRQQDPIKLSHKQASPTAITVISAYFKSGRLYAMRDLIQIFLCVYFQ